MRRLLAVLMLLLLSILAFAGNKHVVLVRYKGHALRFASAKKAHRFEHYLAQQHIDYTVQEYVNGALVSTANPMPVVHTVGGAVTSITNPDFITIAKNNLGVDVAAGDKNGLQTNANSFTQTFTLTGAQSANAVIMPPTQSGPWGSFSVHVTSIGTGLSSVTVQEAGDGSNWGSTFGGLDGSTSAIAAAASLNNPVTFTASASQQRIILNGTQSGGTTTVVVTWRSSPYQAQVALRTSAAEIGYINQGLSAQVLASAARTTTQTSSTITNGNFSKLIVVLNITAASGTGGLQLGLLGVDPISSSTSLLNTLPTAITTTGTYYFIVSPGFAAGNLSTKVSQGISIPCPNTFQLEVVAGDSSSYTYSLAYELIPN